MILFFKLLLTPVLIGLVTLAGRRWGPVVSGWLVGLPLTAGPVALFLALEQGTAFESHAAEGALLGLAAVAGFTLAYGWLAMRTNWLTSILLSWLVYILLILAFGRLTLGLGLAFIGVILCLTVSLLILPGGKSEANGQKAPRWEIFLRMLMALALVLILTGGASLLGPQLSGLFSTFPIYGSILGAFTHRFQGPLPASRLMRGMIAGAFSTACFFTILSELIVPLGIALAFVLASLVALGMHGVSLFLLQRRPSKVSSSLR